MVLAGKRCEARTARIWDVATAEQVATWQKEERAAADHMVAVRRELKERQAAERQETADDQAR